MLNKVYDWLFKNKEGKMVIGQLPNWQIAGAGAAWLVQFVFNDGAIYATARAAFIIFLTVWAYEEIFHGVNGFRRILGLIVVISIYFELFRLLEAAS